MKKLISLFLCCGILGFIYINFSLLKQKTPNTSLLSIQKAVAQECDPFPSGSSPGSQMYYGADETQMITWNYHTLMCPSGVVGSKYNWAIDCTGSNFPSHTCVVRSGIKEDCW